MVPLLQVSYLTKVGQCLDTITAPEDDVDLDRFSLEKFVCGSSDMGDMGTCLHVCTCSVLNFSYQW